jgi:hypothetical protein
MCNCKRISRTVSSCNSSTQPAVGLITAETCSSRWILISKCCVIRLIIGVFISSVRKKSSTNQQNAICEFFAGVGYRNSQKLLCVNRKIVTTNV